MTKIKDKAISICGLFSHRRSHRRPQVPRSHTLYSGQSDLGQLDEYVNIATPLSSHSCYCYFSLVRGGKKSPNHSIDGITTLSRTICRKIRDNIISCPRHKVGKAARCAEETQNQRKTPSCLSFFL